MLRSIFVYLLPFWLGYATALFAQDDAAAAKQAEKPPATATPSDEPAKDAVPTPEGLSLDAVNKRIEELKAGQDPNKDKLLPLLQDTANFLQQAKDEDDQKAAKSFDPEAIAAKLDAIQAKLNAKSDLNFDEIKHRSDSEAIRKEWNDAKAQVDNYSGLLSDLANSLKLRDDRRKVIPAELKEANDELDKLKSQPALQKSDDEAPEVFAARQNKRRAEEQRWTHRKERLTAERAFYDANEKLRPLQQQLYERELDRNQKLRDALKERLDALEKIEAKSVAKEAEKQSEEAAPELKDLAASVAALAQKRTGRDSPLSRAQEVEDQTKREKTQLENLKKQRDRVEQQFTNIVRTETLGFILDEQRAKLPSVRDYEQRILKNARKLPEVRAALADAEDEASNLVHLEDEIQKKIESLPQARQKKLQDKAQELITSKRNLLAQLVTDYRRHKTALDDLIDAESQIIAFSSKYESDLNRWSMWVQVSEPFSLGAFREAGRSLSLLVDESSWEELLHVSVADTVDRPAVSVVLVLLFIAFLVLHARVKRRLREATEEVSQGYLASFYHTWVAFLCTLMLAFWIPVLVMYLGYRLTQTSVEATFTTSVGYGLMSAAFLIGVLRLLQLLLRAQGLGITHFRWQKDRVFRIRLHLSWYMLTVVPITFLIALIRNLGNHEAQDSLGRLCHVAGLLLTSVFLYRVLVPPKPKDERSGLKLLTWPQKLMVLFLVLTPLSFAVLSLSGYSYTAVVLSRRLGITAGILLVLVIINEMAYRWLYIARGRLALEQARQRQEARDAELAASAERGETSEAPKAFDPKSAGIDLSSVNTQTRQLLTTTFRLAVFLAVWFTWRDVAPPVHILDYEVWESSQLVTVAKQIQGEDASPDITRERVNRWITVGDLLVFVLVIAVTIVASKNLPGLLEITILQNLPLDTGIRYAAGMLARYIVTAVGIVVGASVIGIGMTQVSILLGGLAVGLGFGLQELFGNFVSGIILLFEQPIRIGDIVTVGDVTGTVTRIRIRATTITNWDRKEFIVPNKEFITNQFMNWTLSDAVNRIVITVGVAYGSDTDRARELLLKVCRDHPLVLEDPPPWAIFDAFGDSALNFTLACYLPDLSNRLAVTHDLHTMIDREFKRAGLEIAFPQMDLHLRSIDQEMTPLPLKHTSPVETRVESEKYS